MKYSEVQKANAESLKLYKTPTGPHFKFAIAGVDFDKDICQVNGEWSNIRSVLISILNRQICVTNLRVLSAWKGFGKEFEYYNAGVLNKPSNKVLFASADFYTDDGAEAIAQEYLADIEHATFDGVDAYKSAYSILDEYVNDDYCDLCGNMDTERTNPILVLMRIKRWNGVVYGYKVVKPRNWHDIFGSYGCDSFAYYVDRYNLNFIGYHHDSDCVPNTGILRECKPGVDLTSDQLDVIIQKYEKGDAGNILSRYTQSLRPHFTKVFGFK